MSSEKWKTLYGKGRKNRPGIKEIKSFLPLEVANLFEEFSKRLAREYDIRCKPPVFTQADGWVYSFGRSSVNLLDYVTIEDNAFRVQGFYVSNEAELNEALSMTERVHADGFAQRFALQTAITNERQKENTKRRIARERAELEILSAAINKEKFNRFRWSPKLSRSKLRLLYEKDAKGIFDDELLDDIGFTLYARCIQGRDENLLINEGKLKCHNCRTILKASRTLMQCECGNQYLFRDYMRAFRKENMPTGAATAIFNAFIEDWALARGYAEKMRLVDNLIHEFHINLNSGVKGRFVGINLLDGTKKQIEDFILSLAYGDCGSAEKFITNLKKE